MSSFSSVLLHFRVWGGQFLEESEVTPRGQVVHELTALQMVAFPPFTNYQQLYGLNIPFLAFPSLHLPNPSIHFRSISLSRLFLRLLLLLYSQSFFFFLSVPSWSHPILSSHLPSLIIIFSSVFYRLLSNFIYLFTSFNYILISSVSLLSCHILFSLFQFLLSFLCFCINQYFVCTTFTTSTLPFPYHTVSFLPLPFSSSSHSSHTFSILSSSSHIIFFYLRILNHSHLP